MLERRRQVLELRGEEVPVVENLLQPRRDPAGIVAGREVARNDDELAVARAVLVGGELHRACSGTRVLCLTRTDCRCWIAVPPKAPAGPPRPGRVVAVAA